MGAIFSKKDQKIVSFWNKQTRSWILRTLVIWVVEALGFVLMAWLLPGVQMASWAAGFLFIALVALFNALFWPLLTRLTLPLIVYSLGVGALLLNASILWLGSQFIDGVSFSGLGCLILTAIGITAVNFLLSFLLTIDDDGSYYRHALHRQAKRYRSEEKAPEYPGVIFVEIDGLSEPDLRWAMREGYMPTLSRWLHDGTHQLIGWETDASCQTGACQAGILHGNNSDMPAFRWFEKSNEPRFVSFGNPEDVAAMELHISNGHGLLAVNGYSRVNMFSGDAVDAMMTLGRMTGLAKVYTPYFYPFFSSPYNVTRTIILFVGDVIREWRAQWRQSRQHVWPRLGKEKRGGIFPFKRAFVTIVMPEIVTNTLIGDIFLGEADAVYATYVIYDELAHYNGPTDPETIMGLKRLDQAIHRLERAAQEGERPYQFVILSDHGQTKGATFKQRYHLTLEDLVRKLLPDDIKLHSRLDANEGWERLNTTLTDVVQNDQKLTGKVLRRVTHNYQEDGQVRLGPEHARVEAEQQGRVISAEDAQVHVLASGNLGLVSFADWPERMSYELINQAFPDLIEGLVNHEGIGFVLVNSEKHGGMVIGRHGIYYLENDHVEGDNPLANFRPRAAQHLRRTNSFGNAPDLLINSLYDPEQYEVAAFEEQISSHGGFGGNQAYGFLLYPTTWTINQDEIVGAEQVYRLLKQQLDRLRSVGEGENSDRGNNSSTSA